MKKTTDRLLSMALVFVMMLSMLPAVSVPVMAAEESTTNKKDALGISMANWTQAEKAEAEANLPFGTGYGTWTTLLEKSELYFSMGYDNNTRKTGFFDWNSDEKGNSKTDVKDSDIGKKIIDFKQDQLTSRSENYKIVTTAAVDLKGSGKKEYVANLALQNGKNRLCLYITDSKNNKIGDTVYFNNVAHLSGLEVHQINGAFDVIAGDFDGDGKDTVVVYIPQTDSKKETHGDFSPFIAEYSVTTSGSWTEKSTVAGNVLTLLGNGGAGLGGINKIDTMKNSPLVDLVAEDVDKDGYDELIVTGSMNDVTNGVTQLGTKVFIYDMKSDGSWNQSYYRDDKVYGEGREIQIKDKNNRMVWGGTTVGNIMVSTSTTAVDYPEIITAGFIDGEKDKQQNINVPGSDDIGVSVLRVKEVTDTKNGKNVICEYEEVLNQNIGCNGWTKGGFFENEDVNSLLQLQAYADQGLAAAESVFISGSVYRIDSDNKLKEVYKHTDFGSKDDGAGDGLDGRALTNTIVAAVTAGNFNGNDDGREQLICVTSMKESGKNNAFSRVYCYYYDTESEKYEGKRSSYLTEHKGSFHVSLATLDTDNDSTRAKLESVEREYTAPYVMAILEAAPHFAEIEEGDVGNSETIYGNEYVEGSSTSNSFGFTLGTSVGYEFESTLAQSGAGFEVSLDRAYNWSTANSRSTTWFTEYKNDTSDNVVVVYRCPVVVYTYKDQEGRNLVVEKVGQPANSIITVDEYNAAAEQYGLEQIDDSNAKLGTPGDPASYRKNTSGLENAVQYNGQASASSEDTTAGWQQYYSSGTVTQGLTLTKEQEKTFSYDMEVSLKVFAKGGGFTTSASYGFAYAHEETSINGSSVTKSGTVSGKKEENYDFKWKFAAWNCKIDGITVPVIGYLVDDVVAPPSPPEALEVESTTTDSITLGWERGVRGASQYRIYRVLDTSDTDYVLVGAVSGDENTCTLTGLKPGETYTYVVRGVAFEDDGDAVESVDSAPITVRTQSADSNVVLTLHSSALTNGILQSSGAQANLSVQVTGTNRGSVAYQWQILPNGGSRWQNANTLDAENCTVSGATGATLTLKTIDKSLSGSRLRCVVSVTSTAGDVDIYYSPIAVLDLNGLDTNAAISVSGTDVTGSGTIAAPYAGMANYQAMWAKDSVSYESVPATYTDTNGKVYDIYSYQADETSTTKAYVAINDGKYYAATATETDDPPMGTKTTASAVGNELTLETDKYYSENEGAAETLYTVPDGFDGNAIVSETVGDTTYCKVYAVANDTMAVYWFNAQDGKYYTKSEDTFTEAASQPADSADLRNVYYEDAATLILDAAELTEKDDDGNEMVVSSEYDRYAVYTKGESGNTLAKNIRCVPGTKLYNGSDVYADLTGLSLVYNWESKTEIITGYDPVDGTEITLNANVVDKTGMSVSTQVIFTITNTNTGVATTLTTTSGTPVTWTASAHGLYRIVATAAATNATKTSTAECYYRADDPANDYRLALMQGSTQVTNLAYNGSSVKLVLEKRIDDSWTKVDSGVTYRLNGAELGSSSYTPDYAGNYVFAAVVDNEIVATSVLMVSKKAITITPVWQSSDSGEAINNIPEYQDIKLVATDEHGIELSGLLNGVMAVSCDLYDTNGGLKTSMKTGSYTVAPAYVDTSVEKIFLARYSVTTNNKSLYYVGDAVTVYLSAGENGTVYARYIDPSGTEFAFADGSQINMDYRLKFIAEPKEGWSVDEWTIGIPSKMSYPDHDLSDNCIRYGNTLELTMENMGDLRTFYEYFGEYFKKEIDLSVTFTNSTHKITYRTGNNGTLTATANGGALSSGASVANNATVIFTAAPAEGYMVDKWMVDGAEYKWDSGDLYREETLILENISANSDVSVTFTDAKTTNFYVSAVDEDGNRPAGATITATDAQSNELRKDMELVYASYADAVTFTANLGNSAVSVVKEWQTSTNGMDWTAVPGSGSQNTMTIYSHETSQLHVRAVVVTAQTYILNWDASDITNWGYADEGVGLNAYSNGEQLANGKDFPAFIAVDFVLTLPEQFELVGWTDNVTVDPEDSTLARLDSLKEDTNVKATIRKKPVVTYAAGEHGTISLPGDESGSLFVPTGSNLTFTATPDAKYVVKCWKVDGVDVPDSANRTEYTLTDVSADCTVTVEFELADPMKVDFTSDSNGALTAKGDDNDLTTGEVVPGDTKLEFTAEPKDGFMVKCWKVNGTEVTRENMTQLGVTMDHHLAERLTFNSPNIDVAVEVEFTAYVAYDIPTAGQDVGYTITDVTRTPDVYRISDDTTIRENGDVTFKVAPKEGKKISEITCANAEVTSNGDGSYTVTVNNVTGPIELDLTVASRGNGGGSIGGSNGGGGGGGAGIGGDVTEPNVQIKDNANGNITADTDSAKKGDDVTLTVTPDSGYKLEDLTVLDKNGKRLEVTDLGNGKYSFVMPAGEVEILATFVEDNIQQNFFTDVSEQDYFYDAVLWAVENGITSGVGEDQFAPNMSCTRAQIVTFLWNAAGSPEPISKNNPFTDVKESDYFYKAVLWAVENGITSGTGANTFSSDATCTRAQAAVFLYHYEQNNGGGATGSGMSQAPFSDVPEWCNEAVAWCYQKEITSGTSATTFGTDEDCTRAQIVTFLYRFLHK